MRTTSATAVSPATMAAAADEYSQLGWCVTTTANGISLVTDDMVCGIELPAEVSDGVREFMRANGLVGPVIELPGTNRREIHLATGIAKAELAIASLRKLGITVHTDGAGIPLPPTKLIAGCATWAVRPDEARWIPPVVAVAAAVRSIASAAAKTRPAAIVAS